MARTIVNPTDQTANTTQADVAGSANDDAFPTPASGTQNKVYLYITGFTSATIDIAAGIRTATAKIQYSTNAGGAWTDVGGFTSSRSHGGDGPGTTEVTSRTITISLGSSVNIANVYVRCLATLSGASVQVGDSASSEITAWQIVYGLNAMGFYSDIV